MRAMYYVVIVIKYSQGTLIPEWVIFSLLNVHVIFSDTFCSQADPIIHQTLEINSKKRFSRKHYTMNKKWTSIVEGKVKESLLLTQMMCNFSP